MTDSHITPAEGRIISALSDEQRARHNAIAAKARAAKAQYRVARAEGRTLPHVRLPAAPKPKPPKKKRGRGIQARHVQALWDHMASNASFSDASQALGINQRDITKIITGRVLEQKPELRDLWNATFAAWGDFK